MAATPSTMKALGTEATPFTLPAVGGGTVSRYDFQGKPLLVAFICNHCPYVKHIGSKLGELTRQWAERGLGVVLISSNDVATHPEDAPELMVEFKESYGISIPYLYDESQETAKAYDAACTPDFFLYDADHKLAYRGQFDSARPGSDEPVTGADLQAAVDAVLEGKEAPREQKPSTGCNIKWKPGNEPGFKTIG
jgi:peroxiredoxin